jgi:signal transduction histidine kinase
MSIAAQRGALARLNAGVFDLPVDDLVQINAWLDLSRCLTAGVLIVLTLVLSQTLLPDLAVGLLTGLACFEIALTLPYRRWLATRRWLGALLYTQFAVDNLALTFGLFYAPDLPNEFHFLYLLTIVPCALFSLLCGLTMATLATMAHLFLSDGPWLSTTVLAPIFVFFLIAHQTRFYGDRLAAKSREAESVAQMAEALLAVARALASETSSGSLLQRVTGLARELTDSTWSCVVERNPVSGMYRVQGLASRSGQLDEEIKSVEFRMEAFDQALAHLPPERCLSVTSPAQTPIPANLTLRWAIGPFIAAALRRGDEALGLLLVGQDDPATAFRPATQRLVVGIAQQTVLALDNARLVDELRSASTLKSEFIGTMSHELRSPLNAILGYTEMLRDDAAEEGTAAAAARSDTLARVRFYALQLLEMIQATLDISRLEAGRLPIQPIATELGPFFAAMQAGIPEYWNKPGVAVVWSIPSDLPTALIDAPKLVTVVRNLVHNALKFTEHGEVRVHARLEPAGEDAGGTSGDRLLVTVEDTGVGIPTEQLALVFEMFRQADGSDTRRHGGVGLGLYIVQRLTQAFGGTVRVDSLPDRGSTFTIDLPVQVVAAPHGLAAAVG